MPLPERRKNPDECPECEGFGYTDATCPEGHTGPDGISNWKTTAIGSGCPRCLGTGKLENKK